MLTHHGTNRIETPRLLLRPFLSEDSECMFRNWASDDEVSKFLTWQSHKSITDTENVVNLWVSRYNEMDNYNWAIVLKEINEPIGSIAVVQISERNEYAEIGYCIGKCWWGQGIMTEAFSAVIPYLFKTIGFHSVRAEYAVANPASGRVMEKCGLKYEGTHRQLFKSNSGKYLDINYMSVLKTEYNALEKQTQRCYN